MKNFILAITCLLIINVIFGQATSLGKGNTPSPESTQIASEYFSKLYGNSGNNTFVKAIVLQNNYYIIGKNSEKATITKIDIMGNLVWTKETSSDATWRDIVANKDGNLLLVGHLGVLNTQAKSLIGVVNISTGNFVSLKSYDIKVGGRESLKSIYQNSIPLNSSYPYYIIGFITNSGNEDDVLLVNIDDNGTINFIKKYANADDEFYQGITVGGQSGDMMLYGGLFDGSSYGVTVNISNSGNVESGRFFNSSLYFFSHLTISNPMGYSHILGGRNISNNRAKIIKINGNAVVYNYDIDQVNNISYIYAVPGTQSFIAIGTGNFGGVNKSVLMHFTESGNSLTLNWTKLYETTETAISEGFGRFVSNNKFLYLDSRTNHRNNLGNSDGFLTISQANFENCIDNNITLNITPMVDTLTEFAPTVTDEMIPTATNESSNNISYNDADICQLPCSVSFSYTAGECGVLDFSLQTNLTGDLTYNWTFGTNPQTSSTQQNPSHTYLSNGTFNVCVTVTSGATSCNVCQNVIVNNADVVAPNINCPNNIQISNNTGLCYANLTPQISVTDNCDPNPTCNCIMTGVTSGVMPKNANVQFNVGVTTVICRATDASGRVSQPCTFTVTVFDSEPPKINCPPGITIGCNTDFENLSITGTATATDNCPGVIIGHADSFGGSVCNRTVTRTWKATDVSGAITTCVQVIKIEDRQAPVITCPPNLTLSCGANTNPSQTGSATATDACQNEIAITHLDVISGDECDKTITRTWSANDGCNNISTCVQTIRLRDLTPPTFICGSNTTPIECTQNTSNIGISNVMDNCGGKIDQTKVDVFSVNGCITTINRTWTVTDKCGNSATCSQVITMQDTKPPVLSGCGRKLTIQGVSNANGICNAPVSLSAPSVTDMCDGTVTLTNSYNNTANASGTYPAGQTIITWTAKDDCGLMAMCRDTVVVLPCIACDPCDEVQIIAREIQVDSATCCFALDLNNPCKDNHLGKIEIESLSPELIFGSHTKLSGWNYCAPPVPTEICLDNGQPFLPTGITQNVLKFCIDSAAIVQEIGCWKKIKAGAGFHNIAIKNDGSLWAWGSNNYGQIGDGTNSSRNVPTRVGSLNDWNVIDGGQRHTIAIKNDGSLWAWGSNNLGQLGEGTNINRNVPTRIGNSIDWKEISSDGFHTIAIKNDGSLWAWGSNYYGALGDGTYLNRNSPNRIGNSNNWKGISTGNHHTVAIKNDGSLWAWGLNSSGQLGDGTFISKNIPIQIGILNDWKKIIGCGYNTIAIKNDGSLWAWGNNNFGELGDGTFIKKNIPIRIGNLNDWKDITGGYQHTFAIKNDGSLWGWGNNFYGQLGDGTFINKNIPIRIGNLNDWKDIDSGGNQTKAIKNDGSLWAWGINQQGQLGDGTSIDKNTPTLITCPPSLDGIQNPDIHALSALTLPSMFKIRFYGQDDNTLLCDTTLSLNCGLDTISTCITVKNVYAECVPNAGHYTVYATIDNISSPALIADQLIVTSPDASVGSISPVTLSPLFGPSDPPRMVQFDVTTTPFPDSDGVIKLNFQLRSADGNIYCNQVIGLKVLLPSCNTSCLSCPENTSSSANLIVNGDFSAGNSAFGSGYTHIATGPVNVGHYSVRNSSNLSTPDWACIDHTTGSTQGNFLVANGPRKSVTVWSQNINVISGRTYVFCFFANNLRIDSPNSGPPLMGTRLMPSGQIIITPTVVNNLPNQWMIYTGTFTATTTGNITLEIYNSQGGEFADIAIDDISIIECQNSICPDNIVENGSFAGIIPGDLGADGLAIAWTELTGTTPQVTDVSGCANPGAIQMLGNRVLGEGVFQNINFTSGNSYDITLNARWLKVANRPYPAQLRLMACNNDPLVYNPSNCTTILTSPALSDVNCQNVTGTFNSTTNYNRLYITPWNTSNFNHADSVSFVLLDDLCIVQRESPLCQCPENPTFTLKEGNKNPVTVSCNQSPNTIPVLDCPIEPVTISGNFGCVSSNPNQPCTANTIKWTLDRPVLPDLTGSQSGPNFGISFLVSSITEAGTYSLTLETICNGEKCTCVIKWVQRECADCICPVNPTFTLKDGNKNPVTVSCNQSPATIPVLDCPVEPLSISGNFGCVASNPNMECPANAISWTLDRPTLPDLTGNVNGPNFGVSFIASSIDAPGTYSLNLLTVCNGDTCRCVIKWVQSDCADCNCPANPTFTLKEGNKNPVTVSCNQSPGTIPVLDCPVEPLSISGNFGCVASDPDKPCEANAIKWTLDRPTLPDLIGNASGPIFGISFIESSISAAGTYSLTLETICNGEKCTCVIKWVQKDCADCTCPVNPIFSLKEGTKNPVTVSCNQSPTTIPVLDCPVEPISISGNFGCVAANPNMECAANAISWTLDRPVLPDLTGNVSGPNFGVSFIASTIDVPGTYALTLVTVCNGDTCTCVIKWVQRECADCKCPDNPTFSLKEGNKNPVIVSCNQSPTTIPVLDCPVEPISISGNFGCVSSNPNMPCAANAISWTLDRPVLPDLTGIVSGPNFGVSFIASNIDAPGTYSLNLLTVCNGDTCRCVIKWVQRECADCICPENPTFTLKEGNKNPVTVSCNQSPTTIPVLDCPVEPISISGNFGCVSSNPNMPCAANAISWTLDRPVLPDLTGSTTGPNFGVSFAESNITEAGTYALNLVTVCNGDTCRCVIKWIQQSCSDSCCTLYSNTPVSNPFGLTGGKSILGMDFIDVNGDTHMDHIYATSSTLLYRLNPGNGSNFGNENLLESNFRQPYNCDYDQDGKEDIFGIRFLNNIPFLGYIRNTGGGSFSPFNSIFTLSNVRFAVGDVGQDGVIDLITINSATNSQITYYEGISGPTPSFKSGVAWFTTNISNTFNAEFPIPELFDIDCDGDLDLFLGLSGEIRSFTNNGGVTAPNALPDFNTAGFMTQTYNQVGGSEFINPRYVNIDNDFFTEFFIDYNSAQNLLFFDCITSAVDEPILSAQQFKVAPNPTSNMIHITYTGGEQFNADLTIINMWGQNVMTLNDIHLDQGYSIDMSHLTSGMYLLRIATNQNKRVFIKIIKTD